MGVPELKNKILQQLAVADERALRIVYSVLSEYAKEPVAYDAKGYPLSLEEYHLKVEEALEDIKNGSTFSNEEMALKIKNLKKP